MILLLGFLGVVMGDNQLNGYVYTESGTPGVSITTQDDCLLGAQTLDPTVTSLAHSENFISDISPKGCFKSADGIFFNIHLTGTTCSVQKKCIGRTLPLCAAGTYQNAAHACIDCASGKYQDQAGKTTCTDCSSGKYQDEAGKITCTDCSYGKYQDQAGKITCTGCGSEKYQDEAGKIQCKDCSGGQKPNYIKTGCISSDDQLNGYVYKESGTPNIPITTHEDCLIGAQALDPTVTSLVSANWDSDSSPKGCFKNVGGIFFNIHETGSDCTSYNTCIGRTLPLCATGTYQNAAQCDICASGKYQDEAGKIQCKSCGSREKQDYFKTGCQPVNDQLYGYLYQYSSEECTNLITTSGECLEAAKNLDSGVTTVIIVSLLGDQQGCFQKYDGSLYFNMMNSGVPCNSNSDKRCICAETWCAAGTYQDLTNQEPCKNCPTGYTSNARKSKCEVCIPKIVQKTSGTCDNIITEQECKDEATDRGITWGGTDIVFATHIISPAGCFTQAYNGELKMWYRSSSSDKSCSHMRKCICTDVCTVCPVGTYNDAGACTGCPNNQTSPVGSISIDECAACPSGKKIHNKQCILDDDQIVTGVYIESGNCENNGKSIITSYAGCVRIALALGEENIATGSSANSNSVTGCYYDKYVGKVHFNTASSTKDCGGLQSCICTDKQLCDPGTYESNGGCVACSSGNSEAGKTQCNTDQKRGFSVQTTGASCVGNGNIFLTLEGCQSFMKEMYPLQTDLVEISNGATPYGCLKNSNGIQYQSSTAGLGIIPCSQSQKCLCADNRECTEGTFQNSSLVCETCPLGKYQTSVGKSQCLSDNTGAQTSNYVTKVQGTCTNLITTSEECLFAARYYFRIVISTVQIGSYANSAKGCVRYGGSIRFNTNEYTLSHCEDDTKKCFCRAASAAAIPFCVAGKYQNAAYECEGCASGKYQDEFGKKSCKDCAAEYKPNYENTGCQPENDQYIFINNPSEIPNYYTTIESGYCPYPITSISECYTAAGELGGTNSDTIYSTSYPYGCQLSMADGKYYFNGEPTTVQCGQGSDVRKCVCRNPSILSQVCIAGTYQNSKMECVGCPAGKTSEDGKSVCSKCVAGKYMISTNYREVTSYTCTMSRDVSLITTRVECLAVARALGINVTGVASHTFSNRPKGCFRNGGGIIFNIHESGSWCSSGIPCICKNTPGLYEQCLDCPLGKTSFSGSTALSDCVDTVAKNDGQGLKSAYAALKCTT